jgi:hypothetical protein
MARAFVIRPFGKKLDSKGNSFDFEDIHNQLIAPALDATNLGGSTTGEIIDAGNIREDMFSLILEADLVICDITLLNANVFYELGIRHALRKKSTILIKGLESADAPPFDVLTDRYLPYQASDPAATKNDLIKTIEASLHSSRETDSPIFKMLPSLPEADPTTVQFVPVDFLEEVNRAKAANSKGWLRLLSDEVRDRRFLWSGLRLVAQAQWEVRDYEGARESYELITETYPDDVRSNLALANIYERLYRSSQKSEYLTSSDQAIERVTNNPDSTSQNRVEALALKGRNQKTRWRQGFSIYDNSDDRRLCAMNRELLNAYEAYWAAYEQDLNHFYSGINALQMGSTFLDLAATDDAWLDIFPDDAEANLYLSRLKKNVADLGTIIPIAIDAARKKLETTDPGRVWIDISKADVMFLTQPREQRIIRAYNQAIPKDMSFAWDAAKNQLLLFADLGIKSEVVAKIIERVETRLGEPPKPDDKELHVVIFAGHMIDMPSRAEPRFPENSIEKARTLIRKELEPLKVPNTQLMGYASAAPGADILFHEVCQELEIPTTICLPIPKDDFGSMAFESLDSWRSRYLDLSAKVPILELSHQEGLPRWLHGSEVNPWERGNRWVLEMGLTSDADSVTQIALWDGKEMGDARGGTAHMVKLARDTGKVHIRIIDSNQLVS